MSSLACCTRCGVETDEKGRFAACRSQPPMPPSPVPGLEAFALAPVALKIWIITLCPHCLAEGYQGYARSLVSSSMSLAIKAGGGIIGASLGIAFCFLWYDVKFLERGSLFLKLIPSILVIWFVFSILGLAKALSLRLRGYLRLRNFARSGVVPQNEYEKAYVGEAERILRLLETGREVSAAVHGTFELPQLPEVKLDGQSGTRAIEAVCSSAEELWALLKKKWAWLKPGVIDRLWADAGMEKPKVN